MNKMSNKDAVKLLLSNLSSIQKIRTPIYRRFDNLYRSIMNKFFKPSSVSVSFRLSFNKFFNIKEEDRLIIKSSLNELLSMNKKGIQIENLEKWIDSIYKMGYDIECEVLFVKRTSNEKDQYSGHIAFPGGKYENNDINLLNTCIRETKEEIGLNLLTEFYNNYDTEITNIKRDKNDKNERNDIDKNEITSRVVCCGYDLHTPLGFKYLVTSYIFILFDLDKKVTFEACPREISKVFFTPLGYLYSLKEPNDTRIKRILSKNKYLGEVEIEKVILNNDEQLMIFGMTWRLIYNILNYNQQIMTRANKVTSIKGFTFKGSLSYLIVYFYEFMSTPINVYYFIILITSLFLSKKLYDNMTFSKF